MLSTANRIPLDADQTDLFDGLDDYSLLGILDMVGGFGDLVTLASLSPHARELIWSHNLISEYINKNGHLYIEIGGRNVGSLWFNAVGFPTECLTTESYQVLATLKAFCPIFSRLFIHIDYVHPLSDLPSKVMDYVNQYCSTVPQKLTLTRPNMNYYRAFTAGNVSDVHIHWPQNIGVLPIAKHFPRVEKLHIKPVRNVTITDHLPHLKHLDIWEENSCGYFNFRVFAEKNPQITSAKLVLCKGLDILQEVNELLPNLKSLNYIPQADFEHTMPVRERNTTVQLVRFQNVKDYTINLQTYFENHEQHDSVYASNFAELSRIQFDQLERFEYIASRNSYKSTQVQFAAQYKNVTSLTYASHGLRFEQVLYLVNSLPLLKEITFDPLLSQWMQGSLVRLMEENNLDTIHMDISNAIVQEFRTRTWPEQWDFIIGEDGSHVYSKLICFSRKRDNITST